MSTELKAKNRDLNSKLNALRRDGFVPAILYGHDVKNAPLSVSAKEFEEVLKQAGESTLVDLTIEDKKPVKILIHDVTRDPVSSDPIHIDFYQVNMKEKIKTQIALVFVGESLAVKEMGGVLVKNAHEVEIEALPQDLILQIEVNINSLNTFEDHILIKDLVVPQSIKILAGPEDIVASVIPPREEEVIPAEEMKVEDIKIVVKEDKADEVESVEKEE